MNPHTYARTAPSQAFRNGHTGHANLVRSPKPTTPLLMRIIKRITGGI